MIGYLSGPDLGVYKTKDYLLFEWSDHGRVVFSMSKQGKAARCHFSAEISALRYLKKAFQDFIDFVFNRFKWCSMIIATIIKSKTSIVKLVSHFDFRYVSETRHDVIYARLRNG